MESHVVCYCSIFRPVSIFCSAFTQKQRNTISFPIGEDYWLLANRAIREKKASLKKRGSCTTFSLYTVSVGKRSNPESISPSYKAVNKPCDFVLNTEQLPIEVLVQV